MRRALLLLSVSALVACGEPDPDPTPTPAHEGLVMDASGPSLTLWSDGEALLSFDAQGIQLGVLDELKDNRSYDPLWVEGPETPLNVPPTWHAWASAEGGGEGDFSTTLDFGAGGQATLTATEDAEGRWSLDLVPVPGGPAVGFIKLSARVDAQEAFYGLGEVLDTPNHRGKVRPIQLEVDETVDSLHNHAHAAIPLLIGTRGWGLFVEDPHPGVFDVASQADDRIEVIWGTGMDTAEGLRFHLYTAAHPLDITAHYYATTGAPTLPAPWGLGTVVWRDENEDQAQVIDDLTTMRDLDLAVSGYWIDRPYATGVNSFDFDAGMFDDPQAMIDTAHDLGYRMALWHTPYVSAEQVPELNAQAVAGGFFPPETPPQLNSWSQPIDFTNPAAWDWWQDLIRRYADLGIEGYKLDYAEDMALGQAGGRLRWLMHDGSDERTQHHLYQELYHRIYAETLPPDGGFLLCRTAMYGDQVNGVILWPGDLDATMARRGDAMTDGDEDYRATGGLPASLVIALSMGPSGFAFYGSDTGGYRHAPPDKEIFTRWFEQTALSTVMQIGTNTNDVAWELGGENGFDSEMLDWYREYTRLHTRLFPYQWTYAQRLVDDGRPIMRPFGLARPELGLHPAETYFFGDHLLVAPVMDYGARTRDVPLPPGQWIHWFTGEVLEGDRTATVDAPLGLLPLFLEQGGIVPLLRPTIDTLAPVSDPAAVESYAADPGVLYARIFPGPASRFELFDGSAFEQEAGDSLRVIWTAGGTFTQGAVVELLAQGAPSSVTVGGATASEAPDAESVTPGTWFHDGGSLWVGLPAQGGEVVVH